MSITYAGVTPSVSLTPQIAGHREAIEKIGQTGQKSQRRLYVHSRGLAFEMPAESGWGNRYFTAQGRARLVPDANLVYARRVRRQVRPRCIYQRSRPYYLGKQNTKENGRNLRYCAVPAVAMECLSLIGCAQISIFGDGGHALGFRKTSSRSSSTTPMRAYWNSAPEIRLASGSPRTSSESIRICSPRSYSEKSLNRHGPPEAIAGKTAESQPGVTLAGGTSRLTILSAPGV